MTKRLFLLSFVLLTMSACGQRPANNQLDLSAPDVTISDDQLRLDIGEMLLVGFRGMEVAPDNHIVRDVRDYHIGGVILFEYDAPSGRHVRNIQSPEQVRRLCAALQQLDSAKLFISVDQEGGMVARLKPKYGFSRIISAQEMGEKGADTTRHYARLNAVMLKDLGINLDFAPVVDVNVNPDCPVIGRIKRSFSADPQVVAQMAAIWMEESEKQGVLPCLKHFPGHGSSSADSHNGLVDVTKSWQQSELDPYRTLIAGGHVPMIMSTHVINGNLDNAPATLSHKILTQLLRQELGYEGVVITDDMGMKAITRQYDYAEAIRLTIEAGADMLCLGNNSDSYNPDLVPQTFDIIYRLVREGRISPERIHQSAQRIRRLKRSVR